VDTEANNHLLLAVLNGLVMLTYVIYGLHALSALTGVLMSVSMVIVGIKKKDCAR
jgi:hypothetical protein